MSSDDLHQSPASSLPFPSSAAAADVEGGGVSNGDATNWKTKRPRLTSATSAGAPVDKYHLVYIAFVLYGTGCLTPYACFIAAVDYNQVSLTDIMSVNNIQDLTP